MLFRSGYPGGFSGRSTGRAHQSGRGAQGPAGTGPAADPAALLWEQDPERDREGAAYHAGADIPAGTQDIIPAPAPPFGRLGVIISRLKGKNWAKCKKPDFSKKYEEKACFL